MKKFLYITSSIFLLLSISIFFFYKKEVGYVYEDARSESLKDILVSKTDNIQEGLFRIVHINEDGNRISILILGLDQGELEFERDMNITIEIDEVQLNEYRPIPGYIRIKYVNPDIGILDRIFCNLVSLPNKCTFAKEIDSVTVKSFTFEDIPQDVSSLLLYNLDNLIQSNLSKMEGRRYSPGIDYELGEYVYRFNRDLIKGEDTLKVLETVNDESINIYSNYFFIELIEDQSVKEALVNRLCTDIQGELQRYNFYQAINALLANKYCDAKYDEDLILEYIQEHRYEDYDSNINSRGLFIKDLGLCVISTDGDIKTFCYQAFSEIVKNFDFWFNNNTQICSREGFELDVFCSKEFLYTMHNVFTTNYE